MHRLYEIILFVNSPLICQTLLVIKELTLEVQYTVT